MGLFHLDWHRDLHGYELTDDPPHEPDRRHALSAAEELTRSRDDHSVYVWVQPYLWITRKRGPLESYRPLDLPRLYEKIAEHDPTVDGALAAVKTYGFMIDDGAMSEHVLTVVHAIEFLRELIALKNGGDWYGLHAILEERGDFSVRDALIAEFIPPLQTDRPTFRLRPVSLLTAAVLQLQQDVSVGQLVRQCARSGCGKWFEYKRDTARYCSPKCKDAHKFQKRKEAQR